MATTTNYGWDTPDDTDLVKDGASAIRTLGSSIDTTTKNLNPETTQGDISYRGSTANAKTRLGIGTAGQVLTVNSGATAPEWTTLSGGMTLISTTTLTGASITLSSIPQTYVNLTLIIQNFLPATDDAHLRFRFNADSTANRHQNWGMNELSSAGSSSAFNATSIQVSGNTDNSVNGGLIVINVFDYKNTITRKFISSLSQMIDSTTTTSAKVAAGFGYYNQTTAISSIELFPNTGNFTSGTVLLYGVK